DRIYPHRPGAGNLSTIAVVRTFEAFYKVGSSTHTLLGRAPGCSRVGISSRTTSGNTATAGNHRARLCRCCLFDSRSRPHHSRPAAIHEGVLAYPPGGFARPTSRYSTERFFTHRNSPAFSGHAFAMPSI